MKLIRFIVFINVLLFLDYAFSFEGLPDVPGNMVVPLNNTDVELIKVEIKIDEFNNVKSVYKIKNDSPKEKIIEVGFPLKRHALYGYVEPDHFVVKVNNKSVPIVKTKSANYESFNLATEYEALNIWEIKLDGYEKKDIECSYVIRWFHDDPESEHAHFSFVLDSGLLWRKPIEEVDIFIDLGDIYSDALKKKINLEISPPGYSVVKNRYIKWIFRKWLPKSNIYIEINRYNENSQDETERNNLIRLVNDSIFSKQYEGNLRQYTLYDLEKYGPNKNITKVYVRVLRNEIFARHGREFKSEDLKTIFQGTTWYRLNPDYSDDMLNDIERKNIQFILEYEKKKGWR